MVYRTGRLTVATGLTAVITALLTACGGSGTSVGPLTAAPPATTTDSDLTRPTRPTTGGDTTQVCNNLLAMDSVPAPDTGPAADSTANSAYGAAVGPLLSAARSAAPDELAGYLDVLVPVIADTEKGGPLPVDDPTVLTAVAAYESWAHAFCGFSNVVVMAMDYEFEGLPKTLAVGPTSISVMNHSERGEFHVAALGRVRPGQEVGLKELVDTPIEELGKQLDLLPTTAAAPAGQTAGVLVDLTPGHYFLLCSSQSEENDPTTGHLFKGMLAEFDVE
jgi:hypothetical protein